jgi:hypothetical protein
MDLFVLDDSGPKRDAGIHGAIRYNLHKCRAGPIPVHR